MESEFIAWLRLSLPKPGSDVLVGPGDDAAVLAWRTMGDCVVTTDMLMDGVDFRLGIDEPERIGRKALAVNLSDLAAMGSKPVGAVVSLALPRAGGFELAKRLYAGLLPLAAEFECSIVGGDTNAYDGPLVISVTAFGRVGGQLGPNSPLLRSLARPGDLIVVTGEFGGSILGKQFDFTPRVREAMELARHCGARAAMDVSDGLSLDLSRMCAESQCGAVVRLDEIPIAAAAHRLAEQEPAGGTALEHALSDGEDFELILALSRMDAERAVREQPVAARVTIIGEFIAERGLWSVDSNGKRTALAPRGYEHRMS